jgi:hypothetical protein
MILISAFPADSYRKIGKGDAVLFFFCNTLFMILSSSGMKGDDADAPAGGETADAVFDAFSENGKLLVYLERIA